MPVLQDVLIAARTLSDSDRARLCETLWEEADPAAWSPPSPEWIDEVQRRSEAHDQGHTPPSAWTAVRQRARREAGLDG